MKLRELVSWSGTVDRASYARWGFSLMALKLSLDWLVASVIFGRPWTVLHYYVLPLRGIEEAAGDFDLYRIVMVVLSMPFLYLGMALTTRRLRLLEWPRVTLLLFFVPLVNLVLFVLLLTAAPATESPPERRAARTPRDDRPRSLDRLVPRRRVGVLLLTLAIWVPGGIALLWFYTSALHAYSAGLFLLMPFLLGFTCALLWNYHTSHHLTSTIGFACAVCGVLGCSLLVFGLEGLLCLVMAAFMVLPLVCFGAFVGWHFTHDDSEPWSRRTRNRRTLSGALICLPAMMGWEASLERTPPTYEVTSTIDIDAPPAVVWRHVVSFSEITDTPGWMFRAGLAYPVRAVIEGEGPGAVRRCTFSTGDFVEPIEVWDEPRLLRFGVSASPPTMTEMSPWGEISAPHLEGNFTATRGQFSLEPLPGGGTRLHGTTWYHQDLWPSWYWKLWADAIIHRIHLRVLEHIERLAEE